MPGRALILIAPRKTGNMKQQYRPKFLNNTEQWEKLISYAREIGIDEAMSRMMPTNDERTRWDERTDSATVEGKADAPITSKEQAIEFFNVDTGKWYVDRYVCNSWADYFQVKLYLKRKETDWRTFKDELRQSIKPVKINAHRGGKRRKYAVEIHVTDLHLGKVGFDIENLRHNWTIEQAGDIYRAVIADALARIPADQIDHFILPTGNDLLNINSPKNQTVRGTPQMTTQFFQNLFLFTRRLVAESVINLAQVAPVYLYMVPGNHDGEAVFSMGEALAAQFEGSKGVYVDNTPILRKYHQFGKCFIGFSHGDKIKARDLHNAMSNDRPREFGESKYRFYHVGHLHKNAKRKRLDLAVKDEHHGVEVEICPSLSPTDEWHYQNLYVGNMRRSKTFVYDREKGLVQEFYFNL